MYSMTESHSPKKRSAIKRIYEDKYKLLMVVPFLILVLAIVQIGLQISTTGDFMIKRLSLPMDVLIYCIWDISIICLKPRMQVTF